MKLLSIVQPRVFLKVFDSCEIFCLQNSLEVQANMTRSLWKPNIEGRAGVPGSLWEMEAGRVYRSFQSF